MNKFYEPTSVMIFLLHVLASDALLDDGNDYDCRDLSHVESYIVNETIA